MCLYNFRFMVIKLIIKKDIMMADREEKSRDLTNKSVDRTPGAADDMKKLPSQAEGDPEEAPTEDLKTPGQAEGTREDVDQALRAQEEKEKE
jgi:hypothetical protein